jgi:hypothetical protein
MACVEPFPGISRPESCTFLRIDALTIFESATHRRYLNTAFEFWEFDGAQEEDLCTFGAGLKELGRHLPLKFILTLVSVSSHLCTP